MGDMAEMYRAIDDEIKRRRANSLAENTARLQELGLAFKSHNSGYHVVITHNGKTVDFWPSTEKWRDRSNNRIQGTMRKLLKHLGVTSGNYP